MNPKDTSNEELIELIDADDDAPMIDDFIKELEAKEKDLDIPSDLVIEVDESDVEHDNIHDSFLPQSADLEEALEKALGGQPEIESTPPAPSSPPSAPAADPVRAEMQEQLSALRTENRELKESLQRRQRDFDNYRGRIERERKEMFANILGSLATQVLPVLDNLDRALDSATAAAADEGEKDFETFLEGIVLVNQQLNEVLVGMGVEPISAVGQPFDPKYHEAVASVETDEHPHKTVIEEFLRGYRIDERVIRASMVKVSSASNPQSPAPESE